MGFEFNDMELYPCDICGEALPYEEMYALEDGRIVCLACLDRLESDCE